MKGAIISLFIGILLLALVSLTASVQFFPSAVDVHVHDTYFVLDYWFFILILAVYLGLFFSVGGLLSTRFKGKFFWLLLLVVLSVSVYYVIDFFNVFNSAN